MCQQEKREKEWNENNQQKLYYLMSPPFWPYHRNIKINVTNNRHFVFVYLLGKLDYSLYGQRNNNRLSMCKQINLGHEQISL